MAAELHLAEDALTLHFLLQRFERLIDIVVTNQNLHLAAISCLNHTPTIGTCRIIRNGLPRRKEGDITRPFAIAKMFCITIFRPRAESGA